MTAFTETSWHRPPHIHTIKFLYPQNGSLSRLPTGDQILKCAQLCDVWPAGLAALSPLCSRRGRLSLPGPSSDVAQVHNHGSDRQGRCRAMRNSYVKIHGETRNVKLQIEEEDR